MNPRLARGCFTCRRMLWAWRAGSLSRMRRTASRLLPVIALTIGALAGAAWAQAEEGSSQSDMAVEKTAERLHFKVPADWPIEKRNGVVAPIPVEEYLARKFSSLDQQLQAIEQRVSGLDLRMRILEEAAKKPQPKGLQSLEQSR